MRAVLTIAIGIFMLGNGLRMFNVHPIFRYFIFEPPAGLTRFLRRISKSKTSFATPLFLGAMTVLIPCGVTQAMMAVALGTGDPVQGAAIMFAFILGTTPVFFTIAYFATRLGAVMEKNFTRIAATIVIVLGLVAIDSGLNLAGSPVSVSKFVASLTAQPTLSAPAAQSPENGQNAYVVSVGDDGYNPSVLHLPAEKPVTLSWVTTGTRSCARSVVIPGLNYQKLLPTVGQVAFDIPAQKRGTTIEYSCSMGMYFGKLVFDQN
jgi:hypothetical protein